MKKKHTLVLGVGNDILMDDGIGPRLADHLEKKDLIEDAEYHTINLGGLEILEFIQGYKKVIFIDAIKTKDGVPGALYQFTPADFRETMHLSSLHDVNFLTALKLGKRMKLDVTKDIHIIAIEIVEDTIFGVDFTPPLQARYPEITEEVEEIVKTLCT
ncbi:MAG: hydrogenase maturation protease [Candidatus Aminicenantes bacterium]|nr:hydrogenase maturation protease [Candidatus Aminicenantes bacterium]